MQTQRILVIGKYYYPDIGGVESNTKDVSIALSDKYDVTVICFGTARSNSVEVVDGVTIKRCRIDVIYKSQPISLSMAKYIIFDKADAIHFHAPNFWSNILLLIRFGIRGYVPTVITHHVDIEGRKILRSLLIGFYRHIARRASAVIVTSKKNSDLSRDLPVLGNLITIPLGLDVSKYQLSQADRTAITSWRKRLAGSGPTISFLGRHARYKGIDVLIKALSLIPAANLLIAGSGEYTEAAKNLSRELGLESRVHFLGPVSGFEKLRVLAASDVFAFPSTETTETFGIAQLEAAAMGIPLVVSALPTGVSDFAINKVTALTVPPGDHWALAAAIQDLLKDSGLAESLSNSAYQHLCASFTHKELLDKTVSIFDNIFRQKNYTT